MPMRVGLAVHGRRRVMTRPLSGGETSECREWGSQAQRGRRGRVFEIKYDASLSQNGARTTSTWFSRWRHISSHADKSALPSLPPREITFLIVSHYTAALCHSTQSIWVIMPTRPTHLGNIPRTIRRVQVAQYVFIEAAVRRSSRRRAVGPEWT